MDFQIFTMIRSNGAIKSMTADKHNIMFWQHRDILHDKPIAAVTYLVGCVRQLRIEVGVNLGVGN